MSDDVLAVWLDGFDRPAGHLAKGDAETRVFFANLLPENQQLQRLSGFLK